MIWAIGERVPELIDLQKEVQQTLTNSDRISFRPEKHPYSPHLTLARLNAFQLQRFEIEEIPDIAEDISISLQAASIEVMESQLRRSGAVYTVYQSIPLRREK